MRISFKIMALFLTLPWIITAGESFPLLYAQPQEEMGKWWKNSKIVKELQLSETQVNQIEQSFLDHRGELIPLIDELKRRDNHLSKLMRAESLDDEEILAQAELVAVARAELEKANSSMMLSIRKVLTAKQWNRLGELQDLRNASSALILTRETDADSSSASDTMIVSTPSGEKIYSMEDGIDPPKILYHPNPSYTQEARDAKVEGLVVLEGIIRKDGKVDSLKLLKALGHGLDESAIRTIAEEWRFRPGTLNGQPVDVKANIEVSFRLY